MPGEGSCDWGRTQHNQKHRDSMGEMEVLETLTCQIAKTQGGGWEAGAGCQAKTFRVNAEHNKG